MAESVRGIALVVACHRIHQLVDVVVAGSRNKDQSICQQLQPADRRTECSAVPNGASAKHTRRV